MLAAEAHPAVVTGPGASNRLVARLQGEQIGLRVNGVAVADLTVSSPAPTARYGMLARPGGSDVEALFRNLAIRGL